MNEHEAAPRRPRRLRASGRCRPARSRSWSDTSPSASRAERACAGSQPAVDVLPTSVEQRTPPPALRERLMATVRAEAADEASSAGLGPRIALARHCAGSCCGPAIGLRRRRAAGRAASSRATRCAADSDRREHLRSRPAPAPAAACRARPRRRSSARTAPRRCTSTSCRRSLATEVYEVWVQRARRDGAGEHLRAPPRRHRRGRGARVRSRSRGASFVTREPRGGSERPTTRRRLLEAADSATRVRRPSI